MSETNSPGRDALIESLLRRYDDIVRQNSTDVYDAIRAVAFDEDGLYGVQGEVLDVAESAGAPLDDQQFRDALWDAAERYQSRLRDELTAGESMPTAIAATEAELNAAEAVASEVGGSSAPNFAAFHDVGDANLVVYDHMATQGLDARANFAAVNRVTATVDLLLTPGIDTHDDSGDPLRCDDCGRRMAYDNRREDHRHLVDPERACFLISSETQPATRTRVRGDITARLDRLEEPTIDGHEPPGALGTGL